MTDSAGLVFIFAYIWRDSFGVVRCLFHLYAAFNIHYNTDEN